MPSPATSTVLIVNPTAGRGQAGKSVRRIAAKLREYDGLLNPVWRYTKARGDAEHMARDAANKGASLVVAVGGDGTLHETMNGLMGTDAVLGLIPFGTGNDFARALGVYNNLDRACAAVAQGETKWVDVGVIDGRGTGGPRRFLVLSGTGYDARTAQTVNNGIRFLSGAPAYIWGAILTLRTFVPFHLTLVTDGMERRTNAMFVSVANTPTTGGGMKIAPQAAIDDGLLDICLVGSLSQAALLRQMPNVFAGTHIHHPAVTMLRASQITLDADPPQPLLIDGEVLGTTPATVTVLPRALPMRVPIL